MSLSSLFFEDIKSKPKGKCTNKNYTEKVHICTITTIQIEFSEIKQKLIHKKGFEILSARQINN